MGVQFLNEFILLFAIYILISTAGLICERSGVVNISLNGIMIFSAMSYAMFETLVHKTNGTPSIMLDIVGALISIVVGIVLSLIFGLATISFRANQIITGTGINIISVAFGILMINAYNAKNGGGSAVLNAASNYSTFILFKDVQMTWIIGLLFALLIVGFMYFFLRWTTIGKWIITAGENPFALAAAGKSPIKMRYIAVTISGVLIGIAAVLFDLKVPFYGDVNGIGFLALGVLLLGQWRIIWVTVAALGFSAIFAFTDIYAPAATAYYYHVIPYVMPLLVLPFFTKFSRAPKYAGIPYAQSGR